MKKLTPAMLRELRAIDRHGEPADPYEWSHVPGGLWFWAREKVLGALLDRSLILGEDATGAWRLTDAGKEALKQRGDIGCADG